MDETLDKLNRNPEKFAAYYRENILRSDIFPKVLDAVRRESSEVSFYLCIDPHCHHIFYTNQTITAIFRKCDGCGAITQLHSSASGPVPDVLIMGLCHRTIQSLKRRHEINNVAWNSCDADGVRLRVGDSFPMLDIEQNIQQLSVKGDHFIRGRVNREVLSESGLSFYGNGPIRIRISQINSDQAALLTKLLSDPLIMLDPDRAEKFRDEYVDSRWGEEYTSFVLELRKGRLKVDSAGLDETLTALYHMTQKKIDKRTIIKKDGSIVFPTQKVLENINPFMMRRAFAATEHGRYIDPAQVFNMDE